MGISRGMRLVLFVPFSREFLALSFALFRIGAVVVLIDPGMGRANIFRCLQRVRPHGFVAVPIVHVLRLLKRGTFPDARHHVTVGRRWFWGGRTYDQLLRSGPWCGAGRTDPRDPAAIIFTSGSTGPPKGVCYEHGMFTAQVDMIRDMYGIEPGELDLPGFPLFGLFNAAMGVTTVIPDMDPTRPARVDPERVLQQVHDWQVTQAFGSPAFWNRVGRHCEEHGLRLPSLRRALSAGGPVPPHVLSRMSAVLTGPGSELHTPYGATECLPVASIGSAEALHATAPQTRRGAGTCVGRPFPGVEIVIIEITDGPITARTHVRTLPPGEIGEIIVRSPSATREYDQAQDATRLAKIPDHPGFWHRMGDVGYLDPQGRLWFCGRKAHIVETGQGRMFSVCCEAIFEEHPAVYRSALVGLGERPHQQPVIVIEPEPGSFPRTPSDEQRLRAELLDLGRQSPLTARIETVLFHRSLPVDTRHNVKIQREALTDWVRKQVRE